MQMKFKNSAALIALSVAGIAALIILILTTINNFSMPLNIFFCIAAAAILLGFGQQLLVLGLTGVIFLVKRVRTILKPQAAEYNATTLNEVHA